LAAEAVARACVNAVWMAERIAIDALTLPAARDLADAGGSQSLFKP
jgi:hypothetical protein